MLRPKRDWNPDKTAEVEAVLSQAWKFQREQNGESDRALADGLTSPAARWRRKYETLHADYIHPLEIPDFDAIIGVKLLSLAELDEIGVIISRMGESLFEIEDVESRAEISAALLFVGVWSMDGPFKRFFGEIEEARAFYQTPGKVALIAQAIREAVVAVNPFPPPVKKALGGGGGS